MQNETVKDVLLGLAVMGFALGGFLFVNPTDAPVVEGPGGITWRTLPFIYSGLLLALAALFVILTLLRGPLPLSPDAGKAAPADGDAANGATGGRDTAVAPARWLVGFRRLAVIVILIAYSQALGAFGFAIATPLFLFSLLYVFGRTQPRENALISFIGGFVLWILFAHLLKMPLAGEVWDPVTPALTAAARALGL
jgi:hypothetical protein